MVPILSNRTQTTQIGSHISNKQPFPCGQCFKTYLKKIIALQKIVLRLIYFADRKEHAIPLFVNAKILPVTF